MRILSIFFMLIICSCAVSLTKNSEHTFKLADNEKSPSATIEDMRWLAGRWRGPAFGGEFEETWDAPSAGTMMGMFKAFDKTKGISFYEFMVIEEHQGSLLLKIKHFSPQLVGWEEKDKSVFFPLVYMHQDQVHFSGLSFYKQNENQIIVYVVISEEGEKKTEARFEYNRVMVEKYK